MTARILIVEDHELLAQSVTYALRAEGMDVERVDEISPEHVLAAAQRFEPTVVLLDLHLDSGGETGLDLIEPLRDRGAFVVMVTGETDRIQLAECIEAGAIGVVSKFDPFDHLVASVREAAELGTLMSTAQQQDLLAELRRQRAEDERRQAPFLRLTVREQQVLAGLMDGKSAETIATESYVTMATVRSQIRALLMKLGVNSQLAAVSAARKAGWTYEEPP